MLLKRFWHREEVCAFSRPSAIVTCGDARGSTCLGCLVHRALQHAEQAVAQVRPFNWFQSEFGLHLDWIGHASKLFNNISIQTKNKRIYHLGVIWISTDLIYWTAFCRRPCRVLVLRGRRSLAGRKEPRRQEGKVFKPQNMFCWFDRWRIDDCANNFRCMNRRRQTIKHFLLWVAPLH